MIPVVRANSEEAKKQREEHQIQSQKFVIALKPENVWKEEEAREKRKRTQKATNLLLPQQTGLKRETAAGKRQRMVSMDLQKPLAGLPIDRPFPGFGT